MKKKKLYTNVPGKTKEKLQLIRKSRKTWGGCVNPPNSNLILVNLIGREK